MVDFSLDGIEGGWADHCTPSELIDLIDCPIELARINAHWKSNSKPGYVPITQTELNGILKKALHLLIDDYVYDAAIGR